MGEYLYNIFKQVKEKHGEISLYRLVVKTKITMELAKELEDSEHNKSKIMNAVNELGLEDVQIEEIKKRKSLLRRIFGR